MNFSLDLFIIYCTFFPYFLSDLENKLNGGKNTKIVFDFRRILRKEKKIQICLIV